MLFLRMGLMLFWRRTLKIRWYLMPWFGIDVVASEIFAIFSMYSCFTMRMDAVTELRFVLNCVQICSLFDFFARLKSHFLCLICLFMFELIQGGSFGLTVISLYGVDCFAASLIMLETLSAISSTLFVADIKIQSFSLRSRLYLL